MIDELKEIRDLAEDIKTSNYLYSIHDMSIAILAALDRLEAGEKQQVAASGELGPFGWPWDKRLTDFETVANALDLDGGQCSRAEAMRYLIARVRRAEASRPAPLSTEASGADVRKWKVRLCWPTEENPFNRFTCEVDDIGYSDRIVVVSCPEAEASPAPIAEKGIE